MEVISRAEQYLEFALKNQDTYPTPVSRIDYYLLSLAQEVRNGGADPNTITDAVNNYLTENPVQAMTDEQIISIINEGIGNGAVDVMSEVADGSITKSMLDTDLFYNKWNIEQTSGIWRSIKFMLDATYTDTTLKAEFYVTPTTTQTVAVQANNQTTNIINFIAGEKQFYSVEVTLDSTGANYFMLGSKDGMNYDLSGIYEDVIITINDKIIPITEVTSSVGTVTKETDKEVGFIVTKEEFNTEISKINEKTSNISVYNLNNNLWGNKYRINYVNGTWLTTTFTLDKTYSNCTLEFSAYITLDNTTSMCVGARTTENKVKFTSGEKIKVTKTLEIDDTGVSSFALTTPDGMTYNYSGIYENICITIDGKLVPFTISSKQSDATIEELTNKSGFVYTQKEIDDRMNTMKEEISQSVSDMMVYPFDKTAILPNDFKSGAILNLELYNVPMDILNEGIYIKRLSTWWLDLYYGDGKRFLPSININSSYISQSNNIATYSLNSEGCIINLTIDKSKILGENTQYSKQQTLLSKECIKSVKPSEKTTLSFANSIYVTQGSSRPHAVPIFLDYLYNGQKNKILFENGDDRYYVRSAIGSPNSQSTNIINTKKTINLESDTLSVEPLSFNVVSIEEKTKTEPIKILTIGDSVTAGAITDKQYWAFANEFFALEDLDRNRTTDVMFLGNCNYRETTVTKGETTKTVKSFACGISSWSLNSWMTHESSPFVYFEDSDIEKANPIFSIAKWIERYRTHTDDGVALSIGEEGIGTNITEDNISKVQCCTPNVIYINSTHNDYGEVLENTKAIIQKIRAELPSVKIIVASPMGVTGTWHKDKYINKDWIDSSEITGPNFNWQGSYGQDRLKLLDYLTEQEKLNDWLYIMPQMLIQPTVEGFSYEEVDCGVKTMKQPNKINQMASIHPGTITHKVWGYEMYCLLKYIFRSSDATTNEVTVTLDNTTLSIASGSTSQLTATPSVADTEVTFSSSDEAVATVDSTGLVTAVASGTAYIYAETGTSILPTVCTVTVTE